MRSILVALSLLCFSPNLFSQEELMSKKELRKLAKEQKRAQQLEIEKQKIALTQYMVESHRFVLEADFVSDGRGNRMMVSSNINFVAVDSINATLQIGTPYGIGWNGVGGITVDGRVTKFELRETESRNGKSYTIFTTIMSSIGIYDVTFQISPNGNTHATVRSTRRGQLNYEGKLVPIEVSDVFKGSAF